ncbi:MAG: hypothetical protein K6F34_07230 [Lachnospiraceae bacterium]|nr:hypothetical protein [Lachnospiraceae bacterium]
MKRKLIAVIICAVCISVTGCGKKEAPVEENVHAETEQEAEDKEEPEVPEEEPGEEKPEEKSAGETEEAAEEAVQDDKDVPPAGREELYREILYRYKEAQDGKYSQEQVESMELVTELIQHGWPYAVAGDEVRYLYYDVDSDGNDELIITYYNDIVDIYGYDGKKVRKAFSAGYRDFATLYPGGMLRLDCSISATDYNTIWYQYDTGLGDYFAVFEDRYEEEYGAAYYTFCYYGISDEERKEIEDAYRDYDDYPVWVYEWGDELTKDEYEKIVPKDKAVKLPKGELLSGVVLPDGYVPMVTTDARSGQDDSGQKVEITKDMQKKMNVFLSNFAEQRMQFYDHGRPDMYQVGYFAFLWSYINKSSDVKTEDNYYTVSYDTVKRLADRYLGLNISDDDLNICYRPDENRSFFAKGKYRTPAADGESFSSFAVVRSAEDVGGGNLRLEFTIYDLDTDAYLDNRGIPSKYYSLSEEEVRDKLRINESGCSELTEMEKGYAIVKKDGDSYKLMYYEIYG